MISFSEIETTVKRATKSMGFSWGIAEEVGKNTRLLEMFGLPGIKNINQYFKIYNKDSFENINIYSRSNISKKFYCPIIAGVNFFDQSSSISELKQIEINNLAFPLLFIPFVSRTSEIVGKRIFLKVDNKEFLFNYNQSIYSNYLSGDIVDRSEKMNIQFLENKNSFSEKDWLELYKISENTFVKESEELKQKAALPLLQNELLAAFEHRYMQFQAGKLEEMKYEFLTNLFGFKQFRDYIIEDKKTKAEIIDIDESGQLVLAFEDAYTKAFSLKEVKYVI